MGAGRLPGFQDASHSLRADPKAPTVSAHLRVLFVGQAVSIHTARWISQLRDQGWDLHLFDMLGGLPHAELQGVTEYSMLRPRRLEISPGAPSYGHPFFLKHGWDPFPLSLVGFVVRRLFRGRTARLARLIRSLRPDVIHSFELQTESYHLLAATEMLGGSLGAPWIVTTWGSDIFYFQQFPEHLDRIQRLLRTCDYLIPDCRRDVALARSYGFRGEVPLILPGAGGYHVDAMRERMAPGRASERRLLLLKGYQGWAGRALDALRGLELMADQLLDYEVAVFGASPTVEAEVNALRGRGKLRIRCVSRMPHRDLLSLFGRARVSIGVNATDGVPNAMLEAMTMGAFPIQSDTESTGEWITHGKNGLLVEPGNPQRIADAVKRAITDDALVNAAADYNHRLIREKLDIDVVLPRVIDMYVQSGCRWKADFEMRVALVSLARRGGMVHFLAEIANGVASIAHVAAIVSAEAETDYLDPRIDRVRVQTGRSRLESVVRFLSPATWLRLAVLIKGLRADVVHIAGVHEWNPLIAILCKLQTIPLVYTVHDPEAHPGSPWAIRLADRLTARLADKLVALTRARSTAVACRRERPR